MPLRTALLYLHTLRYIKLKQLTARIGFKLVKPKISFKYIPKVREISSQLTPPIKKKYCLKKTTQFNFLNEEHDLNKIGGWDDPSISKLWRYNLHYFDFINQDCLDNHNNKYIEDQKLIRRWILENIFPAGSGWEPYTISLRIVNWIKWILDAPKENITELEIVTNSLAIQARYLYKRLEYHLLGNHLFANAKALIFAGLFFTGSEAEQWLKRGILILDSELPEQVLADGGHFELSPMYHSVILEDLLDLINITQLYQMYKADPAFNSLSKSSIVWPEIAHKMLYWLQAMCHDDGEISFFNDAAFAIAPSLAQLTIYAQSLGISASAMLNGVIHLASSGYIRYKMDEALILLDVARIGPDYIPGHAHADSLSFELSLFGHRLLVNSGTSCYGISEQRHLERSTAAHNTVVINDINSSQIWAGFRVAKRAYPFDLQIKKNYNVEQANISCAHDGYKYLHGSPIHRRSWQVMPGKFEVWDKIESSIDYPAKAYFHLHPAITVHSITKVGCKLSIPEIQQSIQVEVLTGILKIEKSNWYPQFGVIELSNVIIIDFKNNESLINFSWV